MKKMTKNNLFRWALLGALVLFAGCATAGRGTLNEARRAWSENLYAEALYHASEALRENPDLTSAKAFLRDNTDEALERSRNLFMATENTTVPAELEERYDTYYYLVKFYDNLGKMRMPLVADKRLFGLIKGWTWSTPILDFTKELEESRRAARSGFLAAGEEHIEAGKIAAAHDLLRKVITKFAQEGSKEQEEDLARIIEAFVARGAHFHGSQNPDELLQAIESYEVALRFDSAEERAREGRERKRLVLSDVYLALGQAEENRNTLQSWEAAIEYFRKSLEYNPGNQAAQDGVPRVTERIADHYYQQGVRLSNRLNDRNQVEQGIAAFDQALEWIPNFRDAPVLRQRLVVAREIIDLSQELTPVRNDFSKVEGQVTSLSRSVNRAHQGISDLHNIVNRVEQLEDQLQTVITVSDALSVVPVVGAVFRATSTSLGMVHQPVDSVNRKARLIKTPALDPALREITSVKEQTDGISASMGEIKRELDAAHAIVRGLNNCTRTITELHPLQQLERDLKTLRQSLSGLQEGIAQLAAMQQEVNTTLLQLGEAVPLIGRVNTGVERVMQPLDRISSATNEIQSALNRQISVLGRSFSVQEAIDSSTGAIKRAAEAIMNPLLQRLNIQIPPIPGIEELDRLLDRVEGYLADIRRAGTAVQQAQQQITPVSGQFQKSTQSISDVVISQGCSL
ncbi:hypothetical protein AU468_00170 [Alkalispirochaeta sphaeroplastigenens]|uniref:Uncharacterized protein n=1 Tax=Alkalispirochaeta sphaeroplastigenens TaxID=1187066 RepID=A0A2S4K1I8_9SPIO|nr:hypothetical protein [Alkalispirochaeta sphaeroplastigenens]POR05628.1 hypothetical protein AU468_00170 [Alkalispirochaeta sphaeroplastigenens]